MKKVKIGLNSRYNSKFGTILELSYQHPKTKKWISILEGNEVYYGVVREPNRVKTLRFNATTREHIIIFPETEDGEAAYKAILQHPTIENPENDNLDFDMFYLVDRNAETIRKARIIKYNMIAGNIINNASFPDMRNIAFLMGLNPINKGLQELYVDLIDFEKGELFHNKEIGGAENFVNKHKSPDSEVEIVARKAVILGVIERKGDHYYINSEIIASAMEDLIAYCKQNTEMYEKHIRREVIRQDNLDISEINDLERAEEIEQASNTERKFQEDVGMAQKKVDANKVEPAPIQRPDLVAEVKVEAPVVEAKDQTPEEEKPVGERVSVDEILETLKARCKELKIKGYGPQKNPATLQKMIETREAQLLAATA